ncbi:MAG: glycoside hydrolase family 3 protein [Clostridiales bacterium]|nr:glycoside hydrolase family 3 protein [Clostridiales bacterium]
MSDIILDWNKYRDAALNIAREGSVLLRNEDSVLPLKKGSKAAVFGRMQFHYYKSGTGSGGMVNTGHVPTIEESLEKDPDIIIDRDVKQAYIDWEGSNPVDPGVGWGKERWSQDEMALDPEFVKKAASSNDAAIIVIARTAGEDRDNTPEKGSFFLSDGEEEMIRVVCESFEKTIVLLNVGNIIDMSFVDKYSPSAVMYIWQAGLVGGDACADLITGRAYPSGSLTDTIAYSFEDYPSTANFGNVDPMKDLYCEDIYVGYRYFSTFAPEKVMYPFGFGMGYTTFEMSDISFSSEGTSVSVSVKVTNTGSFAGKKAVLLFASAPKGRLGKPSKVLVGFTKTDELLPGQDRTLKISADASRYASYDDDGRLGLGTGWVLEKGEYIFAIGFDVNDTVSAGTISLSEDTLLEGLKSALRPVESFDRMTSDADGNLIYEKVPVREVQNVDSRLDLVPPEIPQSGRRDIKLSDVKEGRKTLDEFTAQLTDEDLALIIRGEGMSSPKVTTGTAAAFCGVSKELQALGIPAVCCDDGPSGMRIDSGKKAFALPNGTCIACSFNEELTEELFGYFGIEMMTNEVDVILGPGINIHRNPLNGRNFEYFSEDPLLTGLMACAQLRGLHRHEVTATIKHFCANNRETNRRLMDSVASERALREIYLKGFEIAVKEGGARSIMTVYNRINGEYGTANYDLNTAILREQWGYEGIVMTDWWAYIREVPDDPYSKILTEHSLMARAQCDIYMVCPNVEKEHLPESDVYENIQKGNTDLVTRAELQRNAKNILKFAMSTYAMKREAGQAEKIVSIDCPFEGDMIETKVDCYYRINEDPVINVNVNTEICEDFLFGITCDKPGLYNIEITGCSDLNPLAQIPMTVFFNSIPIRVITWNGTDGADTVMNQEMLLTSKYSIMRAHFTANGMRLKTLKFSYICPVEEVTDFEF